MRLVTRKVTLNCRVAPSHLELDKVTDVKEGATPSVAPESTWLDREGTTKSVGCCVVGSWQRVLSC